MKHFVWPLTLLSFSPLLVLATPVSYQQDVAGKQLKLQLEGVSQKDWQARLPQFQHWLAGSQPKQHELIQRCEEWRSVSQHSYSCRLGAIVQQWQQAAKSQLLPDRVELRRQTRAIEQAVVSEANYSKQTWQLDGLAHARLLDDTAVLLKSWFPQLKQMDLQSGVSRLLWSDADTGAIPLNLGTEQALLQQLQLNSVALAQTETADTDQGYKVSYRTFSPLLNPAEGWPVEYGPTATVLAKDAVTAYLLAQSLAVLDLKQGLLLTEQQQAAALIRTDSANWYASNSWYGYLADKSQSQQQLLEISYQLPKFTDANYKRPYVSVWLTDQQKKPVRQISLVGQQSRWYQELNHWWRRLGRKNPEQIDQIAGATQKPGTYQLQWDGRDQQGAVVPWGQYQLHLEVAREHGGHEHLTLPLNWQADLQPVQRQGEAELGVVRLQLHSKDG
jgi:thiamine biosynthesis lipoprotein